MQVEVKISHQESKLVDIDFAFDKTLGIVGMSGSGKSLTLKAILNMLPKEMKSHIKIESDFTLKNGESVSFVPQNPFTSLNPMAKMKEQFFCTKERAAKLLHSVDLGEEILERFPSQLSGGQLQRATIAISLDYSPKLLLLDEPTTALDSDSKEKVLEIIRDLQKKLGFKMIFVAHDLNAVATTCEELLVLKDGKIVEQGITEEVLKNPQQDYTRDLLNSGFKNRGWRK